MNIYCGLLYRCHVSNFFFLVFLLYDDKSNDYVVNQVCIKSSCSLNCFHSFLRYVLVSDSLLDCILIYLFVLFLVKY